MIPLTSSVSQSNLPIGGERPIKQGVTNKVHITVEDLLLYETIFTASWEAYSLFDSDIGVGYISGSSSTDLEAREEGLELSRLLKKTVVGMHNHGSAVNDAVSSLCAIWSCFFSNGGETFIQYFFEDGSLVVQQALEMTSYGEKIVLVGINAKTIFSHSKAYYYESYKGLKACQAKSELAITMPQDKNAWSLSSPRFHERTFFPALLYPFQLHAVSEPKYSSPTVIVEANIAAVVGAIYKGHEKYEYTHHELTDQDCNSVPRAAYLQHTVCSAKQDMDPWADKNIRNIFDFVLTLMRLFEYAVYMSSSFDYRSFLDNDRILVKKRSLRSYSNFKVKPTSTLIFKDGSFLPGCSLSSLIPIGKLPDDTFPMGITPNGDFTHGLFGGFCGHLQTGMCPSKPFGHFPFGSFPYKVFFRGDFSTWLPKSYHKFVRDLGSRAPRNIYSSVFPFGITSDGVFTYTYDVSSDSFVPYECNSTALNITRIRDVLNKKFKEATRRITISTPNSTLTWVTEKQSNITSGATLTTAFDSILLSNTPSGNDTSTLFLDYTHIPNETVGMTKLSLTLSASTTTLPLPKTTQDYDEIARKILSEDPCANASRFYGDRFNYADFFNGFLLPDSTDVDNRLYFPGGIFPNGSFPNKTNEYPYGHFLTASFNYSFPYSAFFSGELLRHHYPILYSKTASEYLLENEQPLTRGWSRSNRSFYFNYSEPQNEEDLFFDYRASLEKMQFQMDLSSTCFFTFYWSTVAVAQMLSFVGQMPKRVRAIALGIISTQVVGNTIDLLNSCRMIWQAPVRIPEVVVQGTLCCYSSGYFLSNAIEFGLPGIRQRLQYIAASSVVDRVNKGFRSTIRQARIVLQLALLVLLSFAFISRFSFQSETDSTSLTRFYDNMHMIIIGVLVVAFASFFFNA